MTPLPQVRATGPALTLYDGGSIERAWSGGGDRLVAETRPPVVQLHAWPGPRTARVATAVRAASPSSALWIGAGVDGVARRVASGSWSVARGVATLVGIARDAAALGASVLVWNAEGGWKAPSGPVRDRLAETVRDALLAVQLACPTLAQAFTSFDHPSFHATFPWKAWLGPGSPVTAAFAQVYAGAGGVQAHRGALPAREARALASWGAAVRASWIRPDVPEGQPGDDQDCDWRPYLQLHHVPATDTVQEALSHPVAALWAAPTRHDPEGLRALRVLCGLHARGFWGPGALARFQASAGITPASGTLGPRTLAALGVP